MENSVISVISVYRITNTENRPEPNLSFGIPRPNFFYRISNHQTEPSQVRFGISEFRFVNRNGHPYQGGVTEGVNLGEQRAAVPGADTETVNPPERRIEATGVEGRVDPIDEDLPTPTQMENAEAVATAQQQLPPSPQRTTPALTMVEHPSSRRPKHGQNSGVQTTPATPSTPAINTSSSQLQLTEEDDALPRWMDKVQSNFTGLNKWVKFLNQKILTHADDVQDHLNEKRAVHASLMDQERAANKTRHHEAEEQRKKLAEETKSLATTQASLEQQITALRDEHQQLRTDYNQFCEEHQRSHADHGRVHAELFKELASIKQSPCTSFTERNKAKASIPVLPMITFHPPSVDLEDADPSLD